jgi:hypothetical protein
MDPDKLAELLSDPDKMNAMMENEGWSADDLLEEAELAAQQLSDEVSAINVV